LALGPALKIGGQVVLDAPKDGQTTLVPLPYWAIMNLPFLDRLRGPSRHVVLMQLAIAIAAAAGWASIVKKLERFKTQRIGIAGLLTVVILFESLFMFPYAMTTVPISNVYRQLAEENLDGGILELPMALDRQAPEGRWFLNVFLRMYEGTIHRHPIVGGLAGRPDPEVIIFNETTPYIRELLGADRVLHHNIEDPFHQDWGVLARVGPSILQSYNIDYVILHKDTLFDDELRFLSDTLSQQLGEPFFDDGTVVAYRVMAADSIDWPRVDQMTVVASKGWYLPLWNGARVVRRMVENGQVVILSPERQIARLKLELNSRPGANNLVQISVNGHLLEASSLPKEGKNLVTRPFELKKGHNVVSFEVLGDSQYVGNQADIMQFDAEVSKLEVVAVDAVVFSSNAFTARFGQNIELLGVEWDAEYDEIMARNVNVTLYWRGGAPIKESYKVFVHLLDRAGNLIAQHDSVPVDWSRPTNAWQPGEIIVDRHQVTLPAAGSIDRIGVGMYDPESLRRLEAVVHKGAVHLVDNSVQLGWVP
jgi:hypothetical protein